VIAVISKLMVVTLFENGGFSNNSARMVGAGKISRGEMALIVLQSSTGAKFLKNIAHQWLSRFNQKLGVANDFEILFEKSHKHA
jgi:Kef-type K+ transport system membrane component KefB